ncbi:MAG: acyl-CoA thioesterase [Lachnospiraceae bacterium]|nr:acyl-CoA thioesterase [Lachnospiraceae bacterium]
MTPYTHKVQYYETDKMGITHHSNYIRFCEEARIDFMERLGYGYDQMEADGIGSPVVSVKCDYKKSTTFADVIEIAVKVLDVTPVKLTLQYTMTVFGKTVCTAESAHCFLNSKGHILRIDKDLPEFFEKLNACR